MELNSLDRVPISYLKWKSKKLKLNELQKKYGLPVIEGSEGGIKSLDEAKSIGKEIGYPLLIKAAGGGGGKE